jgi:hypothetical protein
MKSVSVSSRSKAINELLKQAQAANILLRSSNGEQFILARISDVQSFYVGSSNDFAEEVKATRANKKLMKFLDERGAKAKKGKRTSLASVRKELEQG